MSQPAEIHTLAGAYALDALSEFERASFDRHIAGCEACALEVAELTESAARLAAPAWQAPPPRLREVVLTEVTRTRQVSATRPERVPREVRRWRNWTAAAVAAGVVALGGIATVWVVQERKVGDMRQQAEALRVEQARVAQVLAAGDAQVHTATARGGGQMIVAVSPRLDDGVVLLDDLPPPTPDQAYQLWLISDGEPTSAGVLAAGQGSGTAVIDSIGDAEALAVTLEPAGGSPEPTTSVLAELTLA